MSKRILLPTISLRSRTLPRQIISLVIGKETSNLLRVRRLQQTSQVTFDMHRTPESFPWRLLVGALIVRIPTRSTPKNLDVYSVALIRCKASWEFVSQRLRRRRTQRSKDTNIIWCTSRSHVGYINICTLSGFSISWRLRGVSASSSFHLCKLRIQASHSRL